MKIQIADILQDLGSSKNFDVSLILQDTIFQGEPLTFKKPLSVTGQITNSGSMLDLQAQVNGEVILQCGACLDTYEQCLDFPFDARLVKSTEEENPDNFLYEGNEIDLSEIILEFILSELPIQRRCLEHCKGLCLECGTNLNKQKCQCIKTEEENPDLPLDERLQVLKDYFSTEDKEV